jgi:hypothetical protein
MAGGTNADLAALDSIAGRLSASADGLDAVGSTSPGVPDAGEVSGLMGAALAHLTESAGNLVVGLKGASEQVSRARQGYATTDQATAATFRGY